MQNCITSELLIIFLSPLSSANIPFAPTGMPESIELDVEVPVVELAPLAVVLGRVATKSIPQREDVELRLFRFITAKGRRRYRAR